MKYSKNAIMIASVSIEENSIVEIARYMIVGESWPKQQHHI
ncbi:MAG: hypothetical protein ACK4K0_08660 [Flavobacteriales bacterium]